jgi:hypothetical protein
MDTGMQEETTLRGDEQAIRKYIQEQEAEDKPHEQLEMFKDGEQHNRL